jgi:hypothetical protein
MNPLVQGMSAINPTHRFTLSQAQECFFSQVKPEMEERLAALPPLKRHYF